LQPGLKTGDVIIVLEQQPHPTFRRIRGGDDLYTEVTISLNEALRTRTDTHSLASLPSPLTPALLLVGFELRLPHLDKAPIIVKPRVGAHIPKHGSIKMIANEGMPLRNNPNRKGNLYIKFNIDMPDVPFAKPEELAQVR